LSEFRTDSNCGEYKLSIRQKPATNKRSRTFIATERQARLKARRNLKRKLKRQAKKDAAVHGENSQQMRSGSGSESNVETHRIAFLFGGAWLPRPAKLPPAFMANEITRHISQGRYFFARNFVLHGEKEIIFRGPKGS
jgi:hypothetical protein